MSFHVIASLGDLEWMAQPPIFFPSPVMTILTKECERDAAPLLAGVFSSFIGGTLVKAPSYQSARQSGSRRVSAGSITTTWPNTDTLGAAALGPHVSHRTEDSSATEVIPARTASPWVSWSPAILRGSSVFGRSSLLGPLLQRI